MDIPSSTRREMLRFAEMIAEIAANQAPDATIKSELYRVVKSIRQRYGYSEADKDREVLRLVRTGASTVPDLVRETGWAEVDVWKITRRLEEMQLVRFQKLSVTGKGRPAVLIFAVD